jgi:threonylcarbamoyladenosine tRNA methylthiotransferase MtaB
MKVYLDTVGCRLNQSEIESYGRQFRLAGHTLVSESHEADLVIVNTCAVTGAAASDSRQKIRQAARAGANTIVATGCWSTLNPQETAALPGVSRIIPNIEKDRLVADLLQLPAENFDVEPVQRELIPGARARTRAFIKVQDGCDNRCTFCVTTLARGSGRSRKTAEVIADIEAAIYGPDGAKEVVLTGVHLGSWGYDFDRPSHLRSLVDSILANTGVPRLRLSSLEPWDLDDDFFALWQNPRLCRHLHLPLQSGCVATLHRMARKTTPKAYANLVKVARQAIPGVAITTDIITGFPGETEAEFQESLNFVRNMHFAGGHTFTYSLRPGTAAARMTDQIPYPKRKARNHEMQQVLAQSARSYRYNFLGKEMPVLWESVTALEANTWAMTGLTDNYLRVQAEVPRNFWNHITPVKLTELTKEGLCGIVL